MSKPILVLDFDGVLHSYISGWKGIVEIPDPPVVGSIQFLEDALNWFDVQIYSSRSQHPDGIKAMRNWLQHWAHESAEYEVDEATGKVMEVGEDWTEEWLGRIKWPTDKPPAFLTIDDRAITFTGDFPDAEELQHFKPWWKHD